MTVEAPPRARATATTPETPYVGLVPYREEDADFFFGRDREKQIVAGNLQTSRLTIVYGASGVGKTSLLEAGVVRDLHDDVLANAAAGLERPPFAICSFRTWRDDPLPALVEAIRASAVEALGGEELPPSRPGDPHVETLRSWTDRVRTLLVILDQFEDYFLYHPDEDGESTFAVELPRVVNDPNLRVNVVLSIREDAWARLDRFKGRIPRLFANYFRVEHLSRAAARDAIEGPVAEWNRRGPPAGEPYSVEPALVDAVIEATAAGRLTLAVGGAGPGPEAAGADAIEAPFLQLVMERIWRATVEQGGHELTLAHLEALGGAERIVESHLHDALGTLAPAEQAVAAAVFRHLVTRSRTKIAYSAADLADWTPDDEAEITEVLQKLSRGEGGRILRHVPPAAEGEPVRYELYHDVLAEPILEWRRGYEQEQERRSRIRRRFRRGGLLAGFGLLAAFAALGGWALVQRNDAARATRSATSLALAFSSRDQLAARPDVALLLGLDAYREDPTVQAKSAVISALEAARHSGTVAILHHPGRVRSVTFSRDGGTLASADEDGTVRLWDVRTHGQLRRLKSNVGPVASLAFSPDGRRLAAAGPTRTTVWNLRTGERTTVAGGAPVVFGEDGLTFWTYRTAPGADGIVVERSSARGGRALGYRDVGRSAAVDFDRDGRRVAAAVEGDRVVVYATRRGGEPVELVPSLRRPAGTLDEAVLSPDGATVAAREGSRLFLWSLPGGKQLGPPLESPSALIAVALSPDGRTLAAGTRHGSVLLYDVRTLALLGGPLVGHRGPIKSLAFSPDGRMLATAGGDHTVRLWDLRAGAELGASVSGQVHPSNSVAFGADGRILASADSSDPTVRLWSVPNGREFATLRSDAGKWVSGVAVSPDGTTVAAGGNDDTVRLWELRTRREVRPPLGRRAENTNVWVVAFSPDGRMLAAAGDDRTVRLWDLQRHRQIAALSTDRFGSVGVAFSPNGRLLAASGGGGRVWLWDVQSRKRVAAFRGPSRLVTIAVAFSPDGRTLAASRDDGTVRLWNVGTREQLGPPLQADTGGATGLTFSPDGRTLATTGTDGAIKLWDVASHTALGEPLSIGGVGFGVAISPDGRTLASGGGDGVRLWRGILWHDLADLQTQVCGLVAGGLRPDEWAAIASGIPYRASCPR